MNAVVLWAVIIAAVSVTVAGGLIVWSALMLAGEADERMSKQDREPGVVRYEFWLEQVLEGRGFTQAEVASIRMAVQQAMREVDAEVAA